MTNSFTLARMETMLAQWDPALDARAIFLRCYAMMTGNMVVALQAGEFEDNPWVGTLVEHFAMYYFEALEAFERSSDETPPVWRVAFTAAREPHTHALQNLVLGVNAHINHDLVFAVADLLEGEWAQIDTARRQGRYRDYCLVNAIINQTIDSVQDQVLEKSSPGMSLVDAFLGPLDEMLVTRKINEWREQVWELAIRYVEMPDATARQALREQIETDSLQRANAILGNAGLLGYLKAL